MAALKESAAAQSHFIDLCDMLGKPHPAAVDQVGDRYTFEKHVNKLRGGDKGFADVWMRDHFAWEYKGKHKDLHKAYLQLADYREDLGNPPLLVVCDLNRFQVHTNFTSTNKRIYSFDLDDLQRNGVTASCPLPPLDVLRALFDDISVLRPERTAARVTEDAAKKFLRLAERLELEPRTEKPTKPQIAHFLMRIVFCLFADSIGLLPEHVFRDLVRNHRTRPRKFRRKLTDLFEAMSSEDVEERYFGEHDIKYFNGGLFNDGGTIELNEGDMGILYDAAANLDWSHIEPAIFGTLFERSLDADKRSLIGAHYTSSADILLLIEPVVMQPLRRRWAASRDEILVVLEAERNQVVAKQSAQASLRARGKAEDLLSTWLDELTGVTVLDPACGSGNFLYIVIQQLLDLWKEAKDFALAEGLAVVRQGRISPRQLFGIETDFYAHELSSMVVWIGYLQWMHQHGEPIVNEPILERLDNIERADAILRYDDEGKPYEPEWPKADYIIGNPPFLGSRRLRSELGDIYVADLFDLYRGRVSQEADLVLYWFEKSRAQILSKRSWAAGLIGTQAIRMGSSRSTLERISASMQIFMGWSNRPWVLNGAAVRIALVAFGRDAQRELVLDGRPVDNIPSNLASGVELTSTKSLHENEGNAFQGPVKVGSFEIDEVTARRLLALPLNPNGRPNADVISRWINAKDITGRDRGMYIIDFGSERSGEQAAMYEQPFEYIKTRVLPKRKTNKRARRRIYWWRHGEANLGMRRALQGLSRYIATPRVSTHRFFAWKPVSTLPDSRIVLIAKDNDYFFGVLHSIIHETWSLATSSRHGDGEDGGRTTYNIESCFDTFPFPWPPGKEPHQDSRVQAIAAAAKNLVELRDRWLNPPDTPEFDLAKRTLTNLYNARPQWLDDAHRTLNRAVLAAYGWPDDLTDQQILERLLTLNHERAAAQESPKPKKSPKKSTSSAKTDQSPPNQPGVAPE